MTSNSRKALIVGVNDYPNAELTCCVNDATEIARLLERNEDNSPNFHIKLCTSPNEALSKSTLKKYIEDLFHGNIDVALFYFSGHGHFDSLGGTIVTTDFTSYDEGVSMDDIIKYANQSATRNKIIILDCCYSGSIGNITHSNAAQISEGTTILAASRSDQVALEIDRHGIFTSLLIDCLKGGAADIRGNITPAGIYSYMDQALGAWDQRPVFKTNVTRFVSLRNISPKISLSILRNINTHFPNPDYEFPLTPEHEFTYRDHDPIKVQVFQELQTLYKEGLIVPIGERFMYNAAINNKSCKLTALGCQYWKLSNDGLI